LAPLAGLGLLVGGWEAWRRRRPRSAVARRDQAVILWGTWLLTTVAFFSVAARFQAYYLVTLAPPLVALAAIGVREGWQALRRRSWVGWLLPAALVATGVVEVHILAASPAWAQLLTPVVVGAVLLAAAVLLAWRLATWLGAERLGLRRSGRWLAEAGLSLAVLMLLVAPGAWGVASASTAGSRPGAQPTAFASRPGGVPAGRRTNAAPAAASAASQSDLITYLEQQRGDATYLAATPSSMAAAPIIVASGEPVMSLGGFMGSDPILSVQQFAQLVRTGEVRFYVAGGGFGGGRSTTQIASWVQANCAAVPAQAYGGATQTELYDCASAS